MMTDPIADLLTRIRNGLQARRDWVRIPRSALKVEVAKVLVREGYLKGLREVESKPGEGISKQGWLEVQLKYGPEGERVVHKVERTSRPGRRVYTGATGLKPVLNGLGIRILSTSRGVMSDREARAQKVGGEVLATVY